MSTHPTPIRRALTWAAVALLALGFQALPWVQKGDLALLDAHFRLGRRVAPRAAPTPEVVVVGIDSASIQAIPEPLALYHRPLGQFLEAMAQARPRAVGVDFAMPERSMRAVLPGADEELLRGLLVLRGRAPVVLGRLLGPDGRPRPVYPPLATLAGEAGLGYIMIPGDADGVMRRAQPFLGADGEGATFTARLAQACGVPAPERLIDYSLGQPYDYVPLHQVLAWQTAGLGPRLRDRFQDRVVLLGTVLPFEDRLNVPVHLAAWEASALNTTPGVLVHAQTLRTYLAGSGLRAAPLWGVLALSLAGLALARGRRSGLWLLGAGVLLEGAALFLLRRGVFLPVLACGGPMGGAWLLASGRERLRDRRARLEAEETARTQAESLARMTHELRTPLNAILGLADLALRQGGGLGVAEYLGKIVGASRTLKAVLNEVLDYAKVEAGTLELEAIPFALAEVLARLEDLFGAQARAQGLAWGVVLAPEVPPILVGDPQHLAQVLANLMSNALKFTATGGIQVTVTLSCGLADRAVLRFAVEDTGIGLTEEECGRIFQPYRQANASISRRYGGTGLGLTLAAQVVAAMGGTLAVASRPGQGSTFSFEAAFPIGAPNPSPGPAAAPIRLQGLRVLLVEDEVLNRHVTREMLVGAGAQVALAATALEGVRLALEGQAQVVLMDLQMPDMDGLEAARRIRKRRAEVPIVALTADTHPGILETCRQAGMNGLLLKPYEPEELVRILAAWVPEAPPEAVEDQVQDRPGLGLRTALRRLGGNRALLWQGLGLFRARYAQEAEAIRACLASGDRKGAMLRLHSLKGAAGSLAASGLGEACARLEQGLRREDEAMLPASLEALTLHLDQVLASCPESPAPQPLPRPGASRAALLQDLTEQLRMGSPDAEEAASHLRAWLEGTPQQARMADIQRLIQRYDFKAALREVDQLEAL